MIIRELVNLIGFKINEADWNSAEARVDALQRRMQGFGQKMSLLFTLPFTLLAKSIASNLSNFEQMNVAFETMVGDADKAATLVQDMLEFAAKTPFEIKEIGPTVKMLLAMGATAETVLDELKMLGDVSAGLSVPIERLALNFGQVRTQGKLTGRELRDFAVSGVNLRQELAKVLNVQEKQVEEMTSKGLVTFDHVKKAFENMTGAGGKFSDMMIRQSKTLGGMWSNFMDSITLSMRSLEKDLLPLLKKVLLSVMRAFEFVDKISPKMKTIIFSIGALLAVLGPALVILSSILSLGKFVAGSFSFLGAMAVKSSIPMGLLIGKFVLLAAVIAAVAVIVIAFLEDFWVYMQGGESVVGRFLAPWAELKIKIAQYLAPLLEHINNLWTFIKNIFLSIATLIYAFIKDDVDGGSEQIKDIIKNLVLSIGAILSILSEYIIPILWTIFKTVLKTVKDIIVFVVKAIWDALIDTLTPVFEWLKDKIFGWIDEIKEMLFGFIDTAVNKLRKFGEKFGFIKETPTFGADQTGYASLSPYSPALALGGNGTLRERGVSKNVNVNSTISVQVPYGTPQQQIEAIDKQARASAYEVFNSELRNLVSQYVENE